MRIAQVVVIASVAAVGTACGRFGFDAGDDAVATRCQASGFALPMQLDVGGSPRNIEIADLTGDGRADVIATNGDSASVTVVPGNGDGTFAAATSYPTGAHPWSLAIGDVTQDRVPDLVVGGYDDTLITVYPGEAGGLGARADYPVGTNPQGLALADVDGDGELDVVAAAHGADAVSVLKSAADGALGMHSEYPAGAVPYSVAAGDLDGDGVVDLAVASPGSGNGGSVTTLHGIGDGTFAAPVELPILPGVQPWHVAIAELDADGALDVIVANNFDFDPSGQTISIYPGIGDGTFAAQHDLAAAPYAWWVRAVDLDGDGALDLATAGGMADAASVFHGHRDGTFDARVDFASGADELAIAAGDLDGDMRPDLAVAAQGEGTIFIHRSQCTP